MPALLPEEVAAHLDAHPEVTLFCRDAEGGPVGYPMRITARWDDDLLFSTYRRSAKVTHMERDGRVAVISRVAGHATELSWVSLRGRARVWTPTPDDVDRIFPHRFSDDRVPDTMLELVRQRTLEGKRTILRVTIDDPSVAAVQELAS